MSAPDTPAIRDARDGWPYPRANDRTAWHQIREEDWLELRDCLPPLDWRASWFLVGEPAAHDDDGQPIHALCVMLGDRYFLREIRTDQVNHWLGHIYALDLDAQRQEVQP
jgi:hypothetical protein